MKTIILTNSTKVAIVDDEDYDMLMKHNTSWCVSPHAGVMTRSKWSFRPVSMARLILGLKRGELVVADHIDGDIFYNVRSNLRIASYAQNMQNRRKHKIGTSKYKGVSFDANRKSWKSRLKNNRTEIFLGRFSTEEEAAVAYDVKALEIFGKFAKLNFPTKS